MHWIDFMDKLEPLVADIEKIVEEWRASQEQGKLPPAPAQEEKE
jgi:hypothetical protein